MNAEVFSLSHSSILANFLPDKLELWIILLLQLPHLAKATNWDLFSLLTVSCSYGFLSSHHYYFHFITFFSFWPILNISALLMTWFPGGFAVQPSNLVLGLLSMECKCLYEWQREAVYFCTLRGFCFSVFNPAKLLLLISSFDSLPWIAVADWMRVTN